MGHFKLSNVLEWQQTWGTSLVMGVVVPSLQVISLAYNLFTTTGLDLNTTFCRQQRHLARVAVSVHNYRTNLRLLLLANRTLPPDYLWGLPALTDVQL